MAAWPWPATRHHGSDDLRQPWLTQAQRPAKLGGCVKNFRSADIKIARKLRRLRPDLQHFASLAPRPDARAVKVRSGADDSANVDTTSANGQPILGALLAPATFEHEP